MFERDGRRDKTALSLVYSTLVYEAVSLIKYLTNGSHGAGQGSAKEFSAAGKLAGLLR
jgi:hypothetical protein